MVSAQLIQSSNQHCVFQWRVTFVFLPAVQVFLTPMTELEILCNLSAFAISSRSIVFFKVTVHNQPIGHCVSKVACIRVLNFITKLQTCSNYFCLVHRVELIRTIELILVLRCIVQLIVQFTKYNSSTELFKEIVSTKNRNVCFRVRKKNKVAFPRLYSMTRKIFCVPATSATAERLFSISGFIPGNGRLSLTGENFNRIVFTHCNMNLLETPQCQRTINKKRLIYYLFIYIAK